MIRNSSPTSVLKTTMKDGRSPCSYYTSRSLRSEGSHWSRAAVWYRLDYWLFVAVLGQPGRVTCRVMPSN